MNYANGISNNDADIQTNSAGISSNAAGISSNVADIGTMGDNIEALNVSLFLNLMKEAALNFYIV